MGAHIIMYNAVQDKKNRNREPKGPFIIKNCGGFPNHKIFTDKIDVHNICTLQFFISGKLSENPSEILRHLKLFLSADSKDFFQIGYQLLLRFRHSVFLKETVQQFLQSLSCKIFQFHTFLCECTTVTADTSLFVLLRKNRIPFNKIIYMLFSFRIKSPFFYKKQSILFQDVRPDGKPPAALIGIFTVYKFSHQRSSFSTSTRNELENSPNNPLSASVS